MGEGMGPLIAAPLPWVVQKQIVEQPATGSGPRVAAQPPHHQVTQVRYRYRMLQTIYVKVMPKPAHPFDGRRGHQILYLRHKRIEMKIFIQRTARSFG
jgi:hypothetical protein